MNQQLASFGVELGGDGHAVFRLEVAIRIRRFGHLLTLTDQVLHFTFESAQGKIIKTKFKCETRITKFLSLIFCNSFFKTIVCVPNFFIGLSKD